jgi:hypothetical protein
VAGHKKTHPVNQMSFTNMLKNIFQALNLTYLSASRRMELAPFPHCVNMLTATKRGCQGFIGPLPSAFLDK